MHCHQVVNTVTQLVDRLPENVFITAAPASPPSVISSQDSADTLVNPESPVFQPPANAQEAARNNIIREMVETERKYVQDLEVMQVRYHSLLVNDYLAHPCSQ